jgi:hypothetical protein
MHRLAANVKEVARDDTDEEGFIHVFRSLHNKSLYTEETKDIHLDWIKSTYGTQRVGWIFANKPLMGFLTELMQYDYFEQEGKVPVTMYHTWSTCSAPTYGIKGSVSVVVYHLL